MLDLELNTPDAFPAFPYERPYGIQLDLMRHLYTSVERAQAAIVESPTGTGKTLSLLCATLSWLLHDQERAVRGELHTLASCDSNEPDWVVKQTVQRRRQEIQADRDEYEQRLTEARKRETVLRLKSNARVIKRPRLSQASEPEDDQFLPDDVSDDDSDNVAPAVRQMMRKLERVGKAKEGDQSAQACTKVFYTSRTHSQLTQVVSELRKLRLSRAEEQGSAPIATNGDAPSSRKRAHAEHEVEDSARVRVVSLGSRRQLCINDELRQRATDLDEACRELLNEKGDKRCPYLPGQEDEDRLLDLRDQILASPKDIESLADSGRLAQTCPYFGSRKAIPQAELVLLPYNLLLHRTARDALGIDLSNHVVVIDEAHNLISTLLSISSTRLPLRTLRTALPQLAAYISRFRTRLSTPHLLHLKRLAALLQALQSFAVDWAKQAKSRPNASAELAEVIVPGEFVQRLGRKAEGVNLLEIEEYLRSSKIARKISGYADKLDSDQSDAAKRKAKGTSPPLHAVEAFIVPLCSASEDGRVIVSLTGATEEDVEFRYQLLNPSTEFRDVVAAARSVILAGGTMSPMSDYERQLFSHLSEDKLSTFSCGHIVPPANLQSIIISKGSGGADLEFKFSNRGDTGVLAELGRVLANIATVAPSGMVVFLPSYAFLDLVHSKWRENGLLAQLENKKKVFREPQDGSEVEIVLRNYANEIVATVN